MIQFIILIAIVAIVIKIEAAGIMLFILGVLVVLVLLTRTAFFLIENTNEYQNRSNNAIHPNTVKPKPITYSKVREQKIPVGYQQEYDTATGKMKLIKKSTTVVD